MRAINGVVVDDSLGARPWMEVSIRVTVESQAKRYREYENKHILVSWSSRGQHNGEPYCAYVACPVGCTDLLVRVLIPLVVSMDGGISVELSGDYTVVAMALSLSMWMASSR